MTVYVLWGNRGNSVFIYGIYHSNSQAQAAKDTVPNNGKYVIQPWPVEGYYE